MPYFHYKAISTTGETVQGEIEATSHAALIERLRNQGHIPIRAEEVKTRPNSFNFIRGLLSSRRVTPRDMTLLTRELHTLMRAGLPLERALSSLLHLATDGPLKLLVSDILDRVRGGSSLADAMASHDRIFPQFYVGMVRAGEAGGSLDVVLLRLSEVLERSQEVRETVRSALQYPMLVLLMAAAALVILLTVVVPEFRPLFEEAGAALPLSTRLVVALGDVFKEFWWLIGLGIVGTVMLVRWHNDSPSGRLRWDRWLIGAPLIGELVKKLEVARFSRTLGTLWINGVSLLPALSIVVETIGNRAAANAIAQITPRVKEGEGLARPLLESTIFPPFALQLIHVGEESGQLEDMLLRVADIYDQEVKRSIERLMSLLVPLITIGLGVVVALIIGSMLAAILSAYDLPL